MNHHYPYANYPFSGYCDIPCYHKIYLSSLCHAMYGNPVQQCKSQAPLSTTKITCELVADSANPTSQVFVGGSTYVSLSLEYLKTGTSAKITVTTTENGQKTTWDLGALPDEYQIKENFTTLSPGADILLEVTDCTSRIRWCETICC